jgi:hypothetical protein
MAVRHQLIKRAPEAVWAILADGSRYADWVVGTEDSWPDEGIWPEVGSTIGYIVRRCAPRRELELEVDSGPLGTARIAIDIREWGEHSLVIVDEHPLTVVENYPRDLSDMH